MSQQTKTVFSLRITSNEISYTGQGAGSCQASSDDHGHPSYLISAYRGSSPQYTLSSNHGLSAGSNFRQSTYYRRAG